MPFSLALRFGAGLTLAASRDFQSYLVAGLGLDLSCWDREGYRLITSAGPFVEAGAPLGPTGHRLSLRARALPGWAFDRGFRAALELDLGLDLVLAADRGLLLRIGVSGRSDLPITNGWTLGLGLAW